MFPNSLFKVLTLGSVHLSLFNVLVEVVSPTYIMSLKKRSLENAMSLMYIINRSPKMDPSGTPVLIISSDL